MCFERRKGCNTSSSTAVLSCWSLTVPEQTEFFQLKLCLIERELACLIPMERLMMATCVVEIYVHFSLVVFRAFTVRLRPQVMTSPRTYDLRLAVLKHMTLFNTPKQWPSCNCICKTSHRVCRVTDLFRMRYGIQITAQD